MKSKSYDAIVIGSGFGGAATAYSLSKAGMKTLMLERGNWAKRDDLDWDQREVLIRNRYESNSPHLVKQYGEEHFKEVSPKEVVGGMSVFYGGASLRLRERDFETWPITYEDLEPYYTEAEQVLEVHGETGQDPFEPLRSSGYSFRGIALSPPAERIHAAARALGLSPFQIPLALNFGNNDRTLCVKCITCDGFPCKIQAKNDVTLTFMARAQAFDFEVMPGVIVRRLVENGGRVESIECVESASKRTFSLSAPVVILSAGAIGSPAILLRSGLGQLAGGKWIGKCLMRHCNAVVSALFPFQTNPDRVFHKQICLTDFYEDLRDKYRTSVGTIQDIYTPSSEVLRHFAPRGLKGIVTLSAKFLQNLLCIAEDDPQEKNKVTLSPEQDVYGMEVVKVEHRYSFADYERRDLLIDRAKEVLGKAGGLIKRFYEINTFSHAVGSVRFGADAEQSALDPACRMRGVDNLYVVDGSFMPTSGGVNPSLTIAANALRVGQHIRNGSD